MGKIFEGQTALKIQIDTGVNLAGATVKVKYEKPDGSTGEFTNTTIEDDVNGIISWTPTDVNDLDVTGTWKMWAHILFPGGTVAAGEVFCVEVNKEGM